MVCFPALQQLNNAKQPVILFQPFATFTHTPHTPTRTRTHACLAVWPWDVTLTDIDGDGWDDMVMCSNFDSKVAYNHNEGGTSWGPQRVITVSAQGCRAVGVGDIDNDGAVDVVAGAYNDENDVSCRSCAFRPFVVYVF